jgi:hypothetical protein
MIDKNEAPKGYEAVKEDQGPCIGCIFDRGSDCLKGALQSSCLGDKREDGEDVMFKKKGGTYSDIEGRTIESLGYCEKTGSWEMALSGGKRLVFDVESLCDHDGFCECLDSLIKLDIQDIGGK